MTHTGPCSLSPQELDERVAAWHTLDDALVEAQTTETGAVLRYRPDPTVAAGLVRLIEAERACCPSISIDATITVSVDAAEALRPWVRSTFVASIEPGAVHEAVRAHYAAAAEGGACCGPPAAGETSPSIGAGIYAADVLDALPEGVVQASIGCANPVAVADLATGETVLDLGSGGGLDVVLSARAVGPTGKVYGLDMTDEMLQVARTNLAEVGIGNAEFLLGHIEAVPLPRHSVDVVLSNCVIGLSPDKRAVFAEIYRVLRPGGRMIVADVVADAEATPEQRADVQSWVACMAGSLTRPQYRTVLDVAGFARVSIEDSHVVAKGYTSVIVRAVKPTSAPTA